MSTEVKDGSRVRCYDGCGNVFTWYMVRDEVWNTAMPEYQTIRRALRKRHAGKSGMLDGRTSVNLCFTCLEKRLKRPLTVDDFDLELPVNHGIRLGIKMGRDRYADE